MRKNAEGNEGWYGDTWQFMRDVENAPTIDAVPVVRCNDCKRRKNAKENGKVYWDGYKYYCEIARYGVTDGGFCFYGERKDDES